MKRGLIAAALALIVVAIDFAIFPDLIEDRVLVRSIAANDVVRGELIKLGKYRLHTLRVSYGRLADPQYIASLGPQVDALAVSGYAATVTDKVAVGALAEGGKSILSTRESGRLLEMIQSTPSLPLGKVQVFNPNKDEAGSLATIKTILLLRMKRGEDREAKDALREGLLALLNEARHQGVSGLVLPALSVGIAERSTPTFNDFFNFLFDALAKSSTPRQIDLTLWAGWQTADLEAAVAALNTQWSTRTADRAGHLPTLHRYQLRLVLLGLAICFIASSRQIVLGIKSTIILTTGFALSLLGSFKTIETVSEGFGSDTKTVLLLVFTLILAVGFPQIVNWSVKDLFKGGDDGR